MTTLMTDIDPLTPCGRCGQTKAWHDANPTQHEFYPDGEAVGPIQEPKEEPPPGRGDLALRLALFKAGVITELQVDEAERWIAKGRELGRVLMLEPDEQGVLQWRLLTLEDLRRSLGSAVVAP